MSAEYGICQISRAVLIYHGFLTSPHFGYSPVGLLIKTKKELEMKKNSKYPQSGRSMVEMLGVLGVIGVLSVSGMYGYRMAMNQHKFNKYAKLIDTFAMSVAIENGKGENSIFNTTPADTLESASIWCSAYGQEWCSEQRAGKQSFVLSEGESGVKWYGKDGVSGVYWTAVYGTTPSYCFCDTDIALKISNVKASTCKKLIDLIYDKNYNDFLIGFSGNTIGPSNDREIAKEKICTTPTNVVQQNDLNEAVTISFFFKGQDYEDMNCGSCTNNCKNWGICE